MDSENYTSVTKFVLFGLTDVVEVQHILFGIFLLFYFTALFGNISIVVMTIFNPILHNPMYFFLWNLSILDIFYSSATVPKMLTDFLTLKKTISFAGCITQLHFFHFFGSTEAVLLTVMSYDRYVAIGKPLHYSIIMNSKVCLILALGSWLTGFFHSLLHTIMISKIPFCGDNLVNHFFCDIKPVLMLACSDVSLNLKLLNIISGGLVTIALFLTLLSYTFIGKFLLKIQSAERRNALSTCSAHLTVIFIHFGTASFIYTRPSTQATLNQDKAVAVLFSVVTPVLYPIIYTLRNKDMKRVIKKFIKRRAL